jgi:hypothetical protein
VPKRKSVPYVLVSHLARFNKFWTSRRPLFVLQSLEDLKNRKNSNRAGLSCQSAWRFWPMPGARYDCTAHHHAIPAGLSTGAAPRDAAGLIQSCMGWQESPLPILLPPCLSSPLLPLSPAALLAVAAAVQVFHHCQSRVRPPPRWTLHVPPLSSLSRRLPRTSSGQANYPPSFAILHRSSIEWKSPPATPCPHSLPVFPSRHHRQPTPVSFHPFNTLRMNPRAAPVLTE